MDEPDDFIPFSLTPLDHIVPSICPTIFVSFRLSEYRPCLLRLQNGVDILLSRLPFLSGEIVTDVDSDGRAGRMKVQLPSSSIKDIPMLFVRHFHDKRLPKSQPFAYGNSPIQQDVASLDQSYCPLPLVVSPTGPTAAVRFQANLLADGILLGMSFNHHIADATGAGIILKLLAESCCASSAQDVPPVPNGKIESELRMQLSKVVDSLNPHRNDASGDRQLEDKSTNDVPAPDESKPTRFSSPNLSTRSFVFSNEKLMHLRDLCSSLMRIFLRRNQDSQNKTVTDSSHSHDPPSPNNVLAAVIGYCIGRARAKNGHILSNSAGVSIPVNLRRHFQPPLPDYYIGNAVRVATIFHDILDSSSCPDYDIDKISLAGLCSALDKEKLLCIAQIAFRIRAVVKSTSKEHIQGLISNIKKQNDWNKTPDTIPDLWVSSWRHLSVYDLDFGPEMGKIDSFESPPGMVDGACVILPTSKDTGNTQTAPWDVRLTLKSEDMESLVNDRLFSWVWGE